MNQKISTRERFEAWVLRRSPVADLTRNAAGEYIVIGMQDRYMAFVAGAKWARLYNEAV